MIMLTSGPGRGAFLYLAGALLLAANLWAQSDDLLDMENLDDLLGGGEKTLPEDGGEELSVLEDLLDTKSLTVKANFGLTLGYLGGYGDREAVPAAYTDNLVLDLTGGLSLDFNISRRLRVYQKWSAATPDPELSCGEFFADYYPNDNLSLRAGIFNQTWGESKNFSHTNLIGRKPENFSGSADTLALRLTVPWNTGGFELLSLTRQGFWEGSEPAIEDFGWGVRVNTPSSGLGDITLSWYAHPDLNMRFAGSCKTTLFTRLEAYGELLLSLDKDMVNGGDYSDNVVEPGGREDDPVDYDLNLGLYTDFLEGRLSLGAEYLYMGEETELDGAGNAYYGHNLAGLVRWNQGPWKLEAYTSLNVNDTTGIAGPRFTWYPAEGVDFQAGGGYTWGDKYGSSNADPDNRPVFFFLKLKIAGSWETTL